MFSVTTLKHQGPCGYGVFARRDLEPGEAIFIETPTSRDARCSWTKEEFEALPEKIQARVHHFGFELPNCNIAVMPWIAPYVTGKVDAIPWEDRPDNGEFFNHRCDPNAWWADDFHLVARRPIAAGDEITYDYCTEDMEVAEFNCACGSSNCRGLVSRVDWARPDLWASYGSHWKTHIMNEIRALQAAQAKAAAAAGGNPAASPLLGPMEGEPASNIGDCMAPHDTGCQTTVPAASIHWGYQCSGATSANAGGSNRDGAETDAASSASELASESSETASDSDNEAPLPITA